MPTIQNADIRPITLDEALSVHDILDASRFRLAFNQIPIIGVNNPFSLKVTTASIPGMSSEVFEAPIGGHGRNFRGRKIFNSQLMVGFWVDGQAETLKILRTWHEAVAGTKSGNSIGFLDEYSVSASMYNFDTVGNPVISHAIYQLYPQDVPEIQVSSEASSPMQMQATFRFSWFESNLNDAL